VIDSHSTSEESPGRQPNHNQQQPTCEKHNLSHVFPHLLTVRDRRSADIRAGRVAHPSLSRIVVSPIDGGFVRMIPLG